MSPDVSGEITKTLNSGFISQGSKVEEFEEKLKEFFENSNLLTLNSGTSGLTLAMRLLMKTSKNWPGFDVNEDIVLTPALTCFATTASILANNCKIKWLDVDKETSNIDMNDLRSKLNERTKIVYIVHWGGNPVDLDQLKELQKHHKIKYGYKFKIIEDCAHAFGAKYDGKKLGNHGNICVFSLQAIKHLTCGDGGIIILPNKELYERAKLLRWFGIDRDKRNYNRKDFRLENDIEEYGYKFHMNDINATIGLCNIEYVNEILEKNRKNCEYLYKNLKNNKSIKLLKLSEKSLSSCWLFTIKVDRKNDFIDKMKSYEIVTSQVHNRNDINSCVSEFKTNLPNLDEFEKEMICIPSGWWLTEKDLDFIIEKINLGW
jgi:dTDP-4-amino-4,6-dideoxygalactose transaminase